MKSLINKVDHQADRKMDERKDEKVELKTPARNVELKLKKSYKNKGNKGSFK